MYSPNFPETKIIKFPVFSSESAQASGSQADTDVSASERRVLDDLILEIQRSLDYCVSEFLISPVSNLLLGPIHSVHRTDMINHFAENLSTQVIMLDYNDILDCKYYIEEEVQPRCLLAVGGALRHEQ